MIPEQVYVIPSLIMPTSPYRHARHYVCLLFALLMSSCMMEERLPEVHFVVPAGFRGKFNLVVDSSKGEEASVDHAKTTYKLSGDTTYIASEPPSFQKVKITAEFDDGTKLPMAYSLNMYPNETVVLFGPYHDESDASRYTFMVTTVQDMKERLGKK